MKFKGRSLLHTVIDRVAPQVSRLVLSVENVSDRYSVYGLEQVADALPGHAGPLGGLLSAMRLTAPGQEWLLLVPCDAPFVPLDLGLKLHRAVIDEGRLVGVVSYREELQPTFSLWHRDLLPGLEGAVMGKGMAGFKQYLQQTPHATLEWKKTDISPFYNVNYPTDLKKAERMIRAKRSVEEEIK